MTWVVVCDQELKESSDKVALGPFEFRNVAEDYVRDIESRQTGMVCYGPHHILAVEPVLSKLQRQSVDQYVRGFRK